MKETDWDTVELTGWPVCRHAITWSSEDLAVATGEVVHILTPRNASDSRGVPGHRQWHTFTLRVNQFEFSEWPTQSLATLKHFSIGEEQSDSHVAAFAWSPSGLGLYRRSVLAVLTSNLILSFWETNGKLGEWKRTCIVNHHFQPEPSPESSDDVRLKQRVRSFAWLPPTPELDTNHRTQHFLMIADDTRSISIYAVRKTKFAYGHWMFELLARYQIPVGHNSDFNATTRASLRETLLGSSPITRLDSTEWVTTQGTAKESATAACLCVKVSFGVMAHNRYLSVSVRSLTQEIPDGSVPDHTVSVSIEQSQTPESFPFCQPPSQDLFESSLRGTRSDFNDEYDLGGRVLIRHWGAVYYPDRTKAAACVSLHPSDMIESCLPSRQRTTVIFAILNPSVVANVQDQLKTYEKIITFIAGLPSNMLRTSSDQKILANAITLTELHFASSTSLSQWAVSARAHLNLYATKSPRHITEKSLEDGSVTEIVSAGPHLSEVTIGYKNQAEVVGQESCEVCEALITFSSATSATCANHHYFTRCSLSFLAIQEPGISMYCAQCGKQFLHPSRIEGINGPSLSQALFNRFDVCPFCQGKFRG
ncbi:uncharacterized protein A1O9_02377 [Exophiala aquamarina CBS 119918]|uniref:Transcription factor IIIC putative zinc-finger domain-containing protein n=1 Tax=Exophiala aquamarina CBS 119918 TaxID=1182545 RepID=A0A072PYY7_9EURO|nr:uncharacterized protein A1O9_02377 [Exophiala aquamarina CBS 119918]KEF60815.1 hypothetical protein A1O9_02377 [Exophiala aquamarina CBS 119918]